MSADSLLLPTTPWWQLEGGGHALERIEQRTRAGGALVRVLRSRRAGTAAGLFTEFARDLGFPDYFGRNWPALEDCLTDLAWLPATGYVLVLDGAESLLVDESPRELATFVRLLDRVGQHWGTPIAEGEQWDRPAVPFHTLLVTSTLGRRQALARRLAAAGVPESSTCDLRW